MAVNLERDKHFFHYTTRDKAFGGILAERKLRLSTYSQMRDPLENQHWRFTFSGRGARTDIEVLADVAEQTEFEERANKETRNRSHLLSLTIDAQPETEGERERPPFCFGWARARMWEQYAERYQGVCLAFDRDQLIRAFMKAVGDDVFSSLYNQAVIYNGTGMLPPIIEFDAMRNDPNFFAGYVKANFGTLFFTKILDWQTEHEYRFVAIAEDSSPLSIDYGEALEYVIAGNQLPEWERPAVVAACQQADAQPLLLKWDHWKPGLVDLSNG